MSFWKGRNWSLFLWWIFITQITIILKIIVLTLLGFLNLVLIMISLKFLKLTLFYTDVGTSTYINRFKFYDISAFINQLILH